MAGIGGSWGSREEMLHPRDKRGRFRKTWKMAQRAIDAITNFLDKFNPRTFQSDGQAAQYVFNRAKPNRFGGGQGYPRLHADLDETNEHLRAGDIDDSTQKFIQMMDDSAITTTEPLILSRTMNADAFGLTPETLGLEQGGLEDLTGWVIKDPGYSATVIGTPMGHGPGKVTMTIATPKGTKAIIPARGQNDRAVFLDRDQELAITKVESDGRGGYYMMAVAVPKTNREEHEPLQPGPRGAGLSPQQREERVLQAQRLQSRSSKAETDRAIQEENIRKGNQQLLQNQPNQLPPPQGPPGQQQPTPAPQQPAPQAPPAGVPERTGEPILKESVGGKDVTGKTTGEIAITEPPAPPPEPAAPVNFREVARGLDVPAPGPRRAQWNKAYLGVVGGKDPGDMLRELDADIASNKRRQQLGDTDPDLPRDIRIQEQLADLISSTYGTPRRQQEGTAPAVSPSGPQPTPGAPSTQKKAAPRREPSNLERGTADLEERIASGKVKVTPAAAKKAAPVAKKAAPKKARKAATPKTEAPREAPSAPSQDELRTIQELNARRTNKQGGWVSAEDLTPAAASQLDTLVEKGWLQKQGNLYRIDPRPIGSRGEGVTPSGALVGEVLPAEKPRAARISLTKVNRGAIIRGYRNDSGGFGNFPEEGNPDESRSIQVSVQRIEKVDDEGKVTKALLAPKRRIIGHDVETGRRIESETVPVGSYWDWYNNPSEDTSPDIEGEIVPPRKEVGAGQTPEQFRIPVRGGGFVDTRTGELKKAAPAKAAPSAAERAAPGTAEGKLTAGRLKVGDKILVQKGADGKYRPTNRKTGVDTVEVVDIQTSQRRAGRRTQTERDIIVQTANGDRISITGTGNRTGIQPSQTFRLAPEGGAQPARAPSARDKARRAQELAEASLTRLIKDFSDDQEANREQMSGVASRMQVLRNQRDKLIKGEASPAEVSQRLNHLYQHGADHPFGRAVTEEANKLSEALGELKAPAAKKAAAKVARPAVGAESDLDKLTKDELLAEAERRQVKAPKSWTKDKIKAAIRGGAAPAPVTQESVQLSDLAKDIGIKGDAGGLIPARQLDLKQGLSEQEVADKIFADADRLEASPLPAPSTDESVNRASRKFRDKAVDDLRKLGTRLRARGAPPAEPNAPAAQKPIQVPDRREAFEKAWTGHISMADLPNSAAGRTIAEVRDDVAAGRITPDEGIRRLENDIEMNQADLAEVQRDLRGDLDPADRSRLMDEGEKLRQAVRAQEKASMFMRDHFRRAPEITPDEVKVRVEPEVAKAIDEATPDQLREAARIAGYKTPKGETKEEILQDLVKTIAGEEMERRAAKKRVAAKKLAPAPLVTKKSGDPDYVDVRSIAEGLEMDTSDERMLKAIQEKLDGTGKYNEKPITPAAAGRLLEKWANGPSGPAYGSAVITGVNSDNMAPELQAERDQLQRQFKRWMDLAERLKKTRRRPARKAGEAAPAPPELSPEEKMKLTRASVILGVPKDRLQKQALQRKVEAAPPSSEVLGQIDAMKTMNSREEGEKFLARRTKPELQAIYRASGTAPLSKDTKAQLIQKIVGLHIGARLESQAIREGMAPEGQPSTPRRPDPDDLMGLRILARGGFREDSAGLSPKPSKPVRHVIGKGVPDPSTGPRSQGDEPIHLPNNGADQGLMHYDSELGGLWQDLYYDDQETNSFVNRVARLGDSLGRRQVDLNEVIDQLKRMKSGTANSAVADRIQETIDNLDAPPVKVPKLPGVPPAVQRYLEALANIPTARKTGRVGANNIRESVFDKKLDIVKKINSGDIGRLSEVDRLISQRDLHESVDGAFEMWRLGDRLISPRIQVERTNPRTSKPELVEIENPDYLEFRNWVRGARSQESSGPPAPPSPTPARPQSAGNVTNLPPRTEPPRKATAAPAPPSGATVTRLPVAKGGKLPPGLQEVVRNLRAATTEAEAREALSGLLGVELKRILANLGLSDVGSKAEFIQRLVQFVIK